MPKVVRQFCVVKKRDQKNKLNAIRKFRVVKKRRSQRSRLRLDQAAARRMIGHAYIHIGCQSQEARWLDLGQALLQRTQS